MSYVGEYVPENWSNGVTPLNTLTMTKLSDAIKALDLYASFSNDVSLFNDRDYYWYKNFKEFERGEASWNAINAGTTVSNDTTNTIFNTSKKFLENDNTAGVMGGYITTSHDFTKFGGGSASSTDDSIIVSIYVSDKSKINTIFFSFGTDTSNNYYFSKGSAQLVNGWNSFALKKSNATLWGSMPSGWGSITYFEVYADMTSNALNTHFNIQFIGMSRVDPSNSLYQNTFQKYVSSAFQNYLYNHDDLWGLVQKGSYTGLVSPCIFKLDPVIPVSEPQRQLRLKENVRNFYGLFYWVVMKENYLPAINWYYDLNNYIGVELTNKVLTVNKVIGGTATTVTASISTTATKNIKCYYSIEKEDTNFRVRYKQSDGGYAIIDTDCTSLTAVGLASIQIGGSANNNMFGLLYDFIISNSNTNVIGSANNLSWFD